MPDVAFCNEAARDGPTVAQIEEDKHIIFKENLKSWNYLIRRFILL